MREARKLYLLGFVCPMLCALRDAGYVKLDLAMAFKALELDSIMRLARLDWVGAEESQMAKRYLASLPGFNDQLDAENQSATTSEQHDFMRFAIELPIRKSLGLGFGAHPRIPLGDGCDRRGQRVGVEPRPIVKEVAQAALILVG